MKIVALFLSLSTLAGCTTINVQSGSDASSSSGEDPSSSSTSDSASSSSGSGGHGAGGNEGGSTSSTTTSSTSSSGGSGGSGGTSSSSGSGGSGGGGGEPVCNTCDQMLHGGCEALPISSDNSCPGAADSYTALFQCGMTHCKDPCSTDGTGSYLFPCSTIANNFCDNCLQNNCAAAFAACQ